MGTLICSICLDQLKDKAGLDSCIHEFCFNCIEQWRKEQEQNDRTPDCPFCRTQFTNIIKTDQDTQTETDQDQDQLIDSFLTYQDQLFDSFLTYFLNTNRDYRDLTGLTITANVTVERLVNGEWMEVCELHQTRYEQS